MNRSLRRLVIVVATAVVALTGCSTGSHTQSSQPKGIRGVGLSPGLPKPSFTLTDTGGQPYDLGGETQGYVTLLYFGYTRCPDVCPTHMANIAGALHRLPMSVTSRIKVVFVTTDPARDTPAVLRTWLNNFDPRVIGLTGTDQQVQSAERAAAVPLAVPDPGNPLPNNDGYSVDHAAQVEVFTTDNLAHVEYPSGYKAADWINDLPKLVKGWSTA
jgi:protein SCO1/2